MKNILGCLMLLFSLNGISQVGDDIEKDSLFLEYKEEYFKFVENDYNRKYEEVINNFYKGFVSFKDRVSFKRSQNKEKWLQKNVSKTTFGSSVIAIGLYYKILESQIKYEESDLRRHALLEQLLKKYNKELIDKALF